MSAASSSTHSMQQAPQPAQLTDRNSTVPELAPCQNDHQSNSTFPKAPNIADMLDDSYWTDLPDLAEHSPQAANLFNTDLGDLPFSCLYHSASTGCGLGANIFSSEQLDDSLFQDDDSGCLADMDIASVLADDFSFDSTPDKQLQPGTPSGRMHHVDNLLLQSYPPRSHTPVSKDTGQRNLAGQGSTAVETYANAAMVPSGQTSGLFGSAHEQYASQIDAASGERSAGHQRNRKHPKIVVRLKRPSTKNSKPARPEPVSSSRASARLAYKRWPSRCEASLQRSSPLSQAPANAQLTLHTDSSTKRQSQSTSTQTDFAADAGPAAQMQGRHPLLSANSAEALAEGTRLLLAASTGITTRRQQALLDGNESSAAVKASSWTLLSQANMQLRLKPSVATTATQTEDASQAEAPAAVALAQADTQLDQYGNKLSAASVSSESKAAGSIASGGSDTRCSHVQSEHMPSSEAGQAAATPASAAPDNSTDSLTAPATQTSACQHLAKSGNAPVQHQAQAPYVRADGLNSPPTSPTKAVAHSPQAATAKADAGSPQTSPAGASASSPRLQTRSSSKHGGKASARAKQQAKSPRRARLSPNARLMFQSHTAVASAPVESTHSQTQQAGSLYATAEGHAPGVHQCARNRSRSTVLLTHPPASTAAGAGEHGAAAWPSPKPLVASSADPSAQSGSLMDPAAQSGYPAVQSKDLIKQSGYPGSESEGSATEYACTSCQSAYTDAVAKRHPDVNSHAAKSRASDSHMHQSGYGTGSLADPLEIQLSKAVSLPSSATPRSCSGAQPPIDSLEIQLASDEDATLSQGASRLPQSEVQDTAAGSAKPLGRCGGAAAAAGVIHNTPELSSKSGVASQKAIVNKLPTDHDDSTMPQAKVVSLDRPVGPARASHSQGHTLGATQGRSNHAVDVASPLARHALEPLAEQAALAEQATKATCALPSHASRSPKPSSDQAFDSLPGHAAQHGNSGPDHALQTPSGANNAVQEARLLLCQSQQGSDPATFSIRLKEEDTIPVTRGKATAQAQAKIPNAAAVQAGAAILDKSGAEHHRQTSLSTSQDALKSDLMSITGCRVTRRLVQRLLEPATAESSPASKASLTRAASASLGKPPSKVWDQIGRGTGNTLDNQTAHASSSGGPPLKPTGKPPSKLMGKSQGKSGDGPQAPSASAFGAPNDPLVANSRQQQQSMPTPLPTASVKASKARLSKHEGAVNVPHVLPISPAFLKPHASGKQPKTRLVSELNRTTPTIAKANAPPPSPPATTSLMPSTAMMSPKVTATNSRPAKTAHKLGQSTGVAEPLASAAKPTKSSQAHKPSTTSSSLRLPAPTSERQDAIKQEALATEAAREEVAEHSASQSEGGVKRQRSDASTRSDAPKKTKTLCLTAAGLNPKFLATKNEVLHLIGDRQGVLEGELRRRMGNNPDTSKALRKLHKEGVLQRSGHGGKPDPFKWAKVVMSDHVPAASEQ